MIRQCISLNQLEKALDYCIKFNNHILIEEIGKLSLKQNKLDLSIRCFQYIENVSMVLSLKKLQKQTPNSLEYMGDLSIILCNYSYALQFYFLNGNFSKIIFLCEELKEYSLGLDLLQFIQNQEYLGKEYYQNNL